MWQEAADKIVQGNLTSIFIECSYDNKQKDEHLYGHLNPRHLMVELGMLAEGVELLRRKERLEKLKRKRQSTAGYFGEELRGEQSEKFAPPPFKRRSDGDIGQEALSGAETLRPSTPPPAMFRRESNVSPLSTPIGPPPGAYAMPPANTITKTELRRDWVQPLKGLQVVITHIKDTLTGENMPAKVFADLVALEEREKLGVRFLIAEQGADIYL